MLFSSLQCNDDNSPEIFPPDEEDECGAVVSSEFLINPANLTTSDLDKSYMLDGPIAIYTFTIPTKEDVCPYKHVEVKYTLSMNWPVSNHNFNAYRAEILYGILFNYPLNQDHWKILESAEDVLLVEGTANFGIAVSAGDDPGWYKPFFYIHLDSTGDKEKDHENFKGLVRAIKIEWRHYKYKQKS